MYKWACEYSFKTDFTYPLGSDLIRNNTLHCRILPPDYEHQLTQTVTDSVQLDPITPNHNEYNCNASPHLNSRLSPCLLNKHLT